MAGSDQVEHIFELGIVVIAAPGVVAVGAQPGDLVDGRAEGEEFSSPTASRISMLAPSSVPMVSAPLSASFMFPVPDASWPAVEICSDRSAAGIMIWPPDAVVRNESDPEPPVDGGSLLTTRRHRGSASDESSP